MPQIINAGALDVALTGSEVFSFQEAAGGVASTKHTTLDAIAAFVGHQIIIAASDSPAQWKAWAGTANTCTGTNDGATINAIVALASPIAAPKLAGIMYAPGTYNITTDAILMRTGAYHKPFGGPHSTTVKAVSATCRGMVMLYDGNVHGFGFEGFRFDGNYAAGASAANTHPNCAAAIWFDHRGGVDAGFVTDSGEGSPPVSGFQSSNFTGRAGLLNAKSVSSTSSTSGSPSFLTKTAHTIPVGVVYPAIFTAQGGALSPAVTLNTVTYFVKALGVDTIAVYTDAAATAPIAFTTNGAATATLKVGQTAAGTGTDVDWNGTAYVASISASNPTSSAILVHHRGGRFINGSYSGGTYNRRGIYVVNNSAALVPASNGYVLDDISLTTSADHNGIDIEKCADGTMTNIHVGGGDYCVRLGGSSWRVANVKGYFGVSGGFLDIGSKDNLANINAQDCGGPGITIAGPDTTLVGGASDSNTIGYQFSASRCTAVGIGAFNRGGGGFGPTANGDTQTIGVQFVGNRTSMIVLANCTDPQAIQAPVNLVNNAPTGRVEIVNGDTLIRYGIGRYAPTAVKTASYVAVAGDFVPVHTVAANVIVTLPTAPADQTLVGAGHVQQDAANTVTLTAGGADVIGRAGVTTKAVAVDTAVRLQYNAAAATWYLA